MAIPHIYVAGTQSYLSNNEGLCTSALNAEPVYPKFSRLVTGAKTVTSHGNHNALESTRMDYEHRFWTSNHRYEPLAKQYEQNITRVHPGRATGGKCCWWCYSCVWHKTDISYFEYRGERVLTMSDKTSLDVPEGY